MTQMRMIFFHKNSNFFQQLHPNVSNSLFADRFPAMSGWQRG
jgi:hypothetical protein